MMSVKMESTRKLGHSVSIPLPLIMLERAITLKWRIGLIRTSGCSQLGIASAGVTAPEAGGGSGFTKKLVSWACVAVFENVAITVPSEIPDSVHRQAPQNTTNRLPLNGTLN